jgi:hypothetical protein
MLNFAQIHLEFGALTQDEDVKLGIDASYPRLHRIPSFMKVFLDRINKPIIDAARLKFEAEQDEKEKHDPSFKRGTFDPKKVPGLNTPCTMQVSHAFNTTPHKIPAVSFRRDNQPFVGSGKGSGRGYYILAVNELYNYLTLKYGWTPSVVKGDLDGLQGIVTFGDFHTEFWDKTDILQHNAKDGIAPFDIMASRALKEGKQVSFWWICGLLGGRLVPTWLEGWWTVSQGGVPLYYYYFSDQAAATCTTAPPVKKLPAPDNIVSQGKVTTRYVGQTIPGFAIEWVDPKTHGATATETLTRPDAGASVETTSMTSNWNLKSSAAVQLQVNKGVSTPIK